MKELIDRYKSRFNLLKEWEIRYDTESEYKGQCAINPALKQAVIYEWTGEEGEAKNFIFHELLHINMRAVGDYETKNGFDNEEIFVRDVCSIVEFYRGQL